jgi:hypothetical protein
MEKHSKNWPNHTSIKVMKTTFLLLLTCVVAFAADTNTIPFLTIGAQTFTNVEIGTVTASRVTLYYNGGGQQVAISNLPTYLQKRFNYEPEIAKVNDAIEARKKLESQQRHQDQTRALAAERARQQSAIQQHLREQAHIIEEQRAALGPAETLQIMGAGETQDGGTYITYVGSNGNAKSAYIKNFPLFVITFIGSLESARADVECDEKDRSNYYTSQGSKDANKRKYENLKNRAMTCTMITARPTDYYIRSGVRYWVYQQSTH